MGTTQEELQQEIAELREKVTKYEESQHIDSCMVYTAVDGVHEVGIVARVHGNLHTVHVPETIAKRLVDAYKKITDGGGLTGIDF